jgi:hypothetical protein
MIIGASGSGKSTSMRNFEPNEVGIFNVASKPLPFKKKLRKVDGATYEKIASGLFTEEGKSLPFNTYVIDDSQFLMCFESFNRINEKGYDKFVENGKHFYDVVKYVIDVLPSDTVVYFLHHTDKNEDGMVKAKTIGKMLDNQLTLEGLFSIVLLAEANDGKYQFITQSNGLTTAKSPMEMFPLEIDNDLKFVDDTIREYWELPKRKVLATKQTNTTTNKESK